jgi:NAD(P)H-hydrate epimerase
MKKIDELAVKDHSLTVPKLMEAAGAAFVQAMEESWGSLSEKTIGVVCGKGHNGGDGLVVARLLKKDKISLVVVLAADPEELRDETKKEFAKAKTAKIPVLMVQEKEALKAARTALEECDILVDALLGTGLSRPVEGLTRDLIEMINSLGKPVAAVDVPSGLSADSGSPLGNSVRARLTVTFGLAKIGFFTPSANPFVGQLKTVNIGFPEQLLNAPFLKHELTERVTVQNSLPHYDENIHKGTRGRVLLIAGATGLTGAATLSALGAQRIGAGLVTVACPESLNAILEAKLTEPMTAPVQEVLGGFLSLKAAGRILHLATNVNSVVIGPGIGRHRETGQLLRELLTKLNLPMVVDADALNLLGGQMDIFKTLKAPVVLTPHPGEAAWLLKTTITEVEQNRVKVAKQIAGGYNVTVVLKGRYTVIANPRGEVRLNPTGNRGWATAGTGDVLSGVIGGLLAQRLSAWDAATAGVYLHGLAGEKASRRFGLDGLLAGDLLPFLPRVLRQVREITREPQCPPTGKFKHSGKRS